MTDERFLHELSAVTVLSRAISASDAEALKKLDAMTEDRDLWRGDHDGDCPNAGASSELERIRASHADLVKALDGLMDLFHDPSPFYIKKLGSPITNGDQDKIDDAFVAAQDALENARKVMG